MDTGLAWLVFAAGVGLGMWLSLLATATLGWWLERGRQRRLWRRAQVDLRREPEARGMDPARKPRQPQVHGGRPDWNAMDN